VEKGGNTRHAKRLDGSVAVGFRLAGNHSETTEIAILKKHFNPGLKTPILFSKGIPIFVWGYQSILGGNPALLVRG